MMEEISTRQRDESLPALSLDAVLFSYTSIYFSQRRWMGAVMLLGTMAWPQIGLVGFAGLAIALGAALVLGLDRTLIRSGAYLYNSLLVSLALGYVYSFGLVSLGTLALILPIVSILTLFVTVAMFSVMLQTLGLPPMSLPFVICQLTLPLLLPATRAVQVELDPTLAVPSWTLTSVTLLEYGQAYLRSFGSILFLPHLEFGALVLVALLSHSRQLVLHATLGMVVGVALLAYLPPGMTFPTAAALAFNFMFCGIALGGVYFIPSRGTLGLVVLGSAICAALTSMVMTVFAPLGFVPTALPFNLVVLLVLYVMKLRTSATAIHVTPFVPRSPEENFIRFHLGRARFPHIGFPAIHCPFMGERVVTQGVDGRMTHRLRWKYALDFEVLNEPHERHSGSRDLENYYTFNTPVLCPEDGVVAKTVDHVEDRPIGANNFADNWGNLIIVRLDSGVFVKMCHLRQRSLTVKVGDRVRRGQIVGFCGNSGRSPVPHLHVQLQTSPLVGATTIPFRIRHYFERNGHGLIYHTAGIPDQNARIEGATVEQRIAECFDNISRREFRYKLSHRGRETEETITCAVDDLGNYVFESRTGDRLTASVHEYGFFSLDYRGGRGLLFWFWLGLSRVPFISNSQARWHDTFDVRPMLRPWASAWYDLVGPYWRNPQLTATGTLQAPGTGAYARRSDACVDTCFECDASSFIVARDAIPRRIRTYVAETGWVVAAIVELEDPLFIEQI